VIICIDWVLKRICACLESLLDFHLVLFFFICFTLFCFSSWNWSWLWDNLWLLVFKCFIDHILNSLIIIHILVLWSFDYFRSQTDLFWSRYGGLFDRNCRNFFLNQLWCWSLYSLRTLFIWDSSSQFDWCILGFNRNFWHWLLHFKVRTRLLTL
jgi:hypothetical protein